MFLFITSHQVFWYLLEQISRGVALALVTSWRHCIGIGSFVSLLVILWRCCIGIGNFVKALHWHWRHCVAIRNFVEALCWHWWQQFFAFQRLVFLLFCQFKDDFGENLFFYSFLCPKTTLLRFLGSKTINFLYFFSEENAKRTKFFRVSRATI